MLGLSHIVALVGGDDDISVLDDSLEVLIHVLSFDLELEDSSVDLVNEEDWLDLLSKGLSKHGSVCTQTPST